jgi:hypothetical protein
MTVNCLEMFVQPITLEWNKKGARSLFVYLDVGVLDGYMLWAPATCHLESINIRSISAPAGPSERDSF